MAAGPAYSYLLCTECGFRRQHPLPDPQKEEALYDEVFYEGRGLQAGLDQQGPLMRRLIQTRVATLTELQGGPGSLLDIGAGTGLFVEAGLRAGWKASGVEPSEAAVRMAAAVTAAPVVRGRLEDLDFEHAFDALTLWDVLEHLPDPRGTLVRARGFLVSGGLVAISLPNAAGLKARLRGNRWRYYRPEFGHLSHFSPRTLRLLLEQAGFGPLRVETSGAFNLGRPFRLEPDEVEERRGLLAAVQKLADSAVGGIGLGEDLVAYARARPT